MPYVTITREADRALESASDTPAGLNRSRSRSLPDGRTEIWLGAETLSRLLAIKHPQESLSDTIIRLVAFERSGGKA